MIQLGAKFSVSYHSDVVRFDIKKLPNSIKGRVKSAIENKLMVEPELFGLPLRKSLKGYRKLRVGDYRIVFKIVGKIVKVILIQHRRDVYKNAHKRF